MGSSDYHIRLDCTHVEFGVYRDSVYCPGEDTFLFIEALENDIDYILSKNMLCVMEIGCGSGYISTYFIKLLQRCGKLSPDAGSHRTIPFVITVDINPAATMATVETLERNKVVERADTMTADMFLPLLPQRSQEVLDMVMFNPPYVPSEEIGNPKSAIDRAWEGGFMGREIIDRFLADIGVGPYNTNETVQQYLSNNGIFYLLLEKRNDIPDVIQSIRQRGFHPEVKLK
uniref:Uncharacterized protein n=1 Tax=Babesia bovis TaxID=5865 RepID=A7ATZ3_BABBO|eukprot:XP_001609972.1 hypothetical protein [Babesia bovis T2Bo]